MQKVSCCDKLGKETAGAPQHMTHLTHAPGQNDKALRVNSAHSLALIRSAVRARQAVQHVLGTIGRNLTSSFRWQQNCGLHAAPRSG